MRKNTVHSVFRKRFFPILWAAFPLLLEAKARSGQFIFDCAFWGWRHLACRLFRVGTLEPLPSGIAAHCPALSVYILPVAQLSDHALRDSYEQAERFFALHASSLYENGKPLAVLCSTGLLWPALDAFLPEDSGIL